MARRTLAALLALTALLVITAPAHARGFQVGMAADGLLLNGSESAGREAVAKWRELGVDTVRLQVQWSRVAPSSRSYDAPAGWDPSNHEQLYSWADIDRAVRLLNEAGIRPMLLLGGPPPLWASSSWGR